MKWGIIVIMTTFSVDGHDAVEISMRYDKPFYFETKNDCLVYVKENALELSLFAISKFNGEKQVENIFCIPKEASI